MAMLNLVPQATQNNRLGWRLAAGIGLGWVVSLNGHAAGETIAKVGVGTAPACQTCHGASGGGIAQTGFPRLAGLGAAYMERQLAAFADGTRVSDVMMPVAKALTLVQRTEVSAYYAALPVPGTEPGMPASLPAPATAASVVGAALATRGRWADKLPACEQCHGPGGRGVGSDFPPLAGQGATYLANQLTAWKKGERPPGPMALMSVIAKKLSADEVLAIADHYAASPARDDR